MAKVLLIEDDKNMQDLVSHYIRSAGHSVVTASDGEVGLSTFQADTFDIVITDILLPKRDGIQLIEQMLAERPKLKIIAVSAGGMVEPEAYLDTARNLRANATITNPFDKETLIGTLNAVLRER